MHTTLIRHWGPCLLAVLLLAGCSTAAQRTAAPTQVPATPAAVPHLAVLVGTRWDLVEMGTAAAPAPPLRDHRPTLKFVDLEEAQGSLGCNSYWAPYTLSATTLTFDEVG